MPAPKTQTTDLTKDTITTDVVPANDYFESLETTPQQPGQREVSLAFVGLYHAKSKPEVAEAMKQAGGQLNQYYLSHNGATIPLSPFKFYHFESKKYYTKQDSQGRITDITAIEPADKDFKEHGFALIGVILPSGDIVPARFQARAGQYASLKAARQMFDQARDVTKFAALGESYAVAGTLPLPARVTATASAQMQKSAGSGFDYIKGNCTCSPTKIDAGNKFLTAKNNPEWMSELTKLRNVYSKTIQGLEARANGGAK